MAFNLDENDQRDIDALIQQSRVNDFTLSFLMVNLWVYSIGVLVLFSLFYFCCRLVRRDKERFIQKMHKMNAIDHEQEEDDHEENLKLMQLDESLRVS